MFFSANTGLCLTVQSFLGEVPFFILSDKIVKYLGVSHSLSLTLLAFAVRYLSYGYLIKTGNVYYVLIVELTQGPTFGLFYVVMTALAQDFSLKTQMVLNDNFDEETAIVDKNDVKNVTKSEQTQDDLENWKKNPEVFLIRSQDSIVAVETAVDQKETPKELVSVRDTLSLDHLVSSCPSSLKSNQGDPGEHSSVQKEPLHKSMKRKGKEETTDVVIVVVKTASVLSSIDDEHVDAASIKERPSPSSLVTSTAVNILPEQDQERIPDKSSVITSKEEKKQLQENPKKRDEEDEVTIILDGNERRESDSCRSSSLTTIRNDACCLFNQECKECLDHSDDLYKLDEQEPQIYATMQGLMSGVYEGAGLGVGALIAGLTIDRLGIAYTWAFAGYFSLAVCVSNLFLHVNLDNCSFDRFWTFRVMVNVSSFTDSFLSQIYA